eukprot:scaffold328049_cov54-Tisochrysis_lutea.AAC.1
MAMGTQSTPLSIVPNNIPSRGTSPEVVSTSGPDPWRVFDGDQTSIWRSRSGGKKHQYTSGYRFQQQFSCLVQASHHSHTKKLPKTSKLLLVCVVMERPKR